jgi:hypothetical protein
MNKKFLVWLVILFIFGLFPGAALAYKYNANTGNVTDIPTYRAGGALAVSPQVFGSAMDDLGALIGTNPNRVQYIWIGPEQYIDDPNTDGSVRSSGSGTGTSADDQLTTATGNSMGDDADTVGQFSGTGGKYFHYFRYETTSAINKFYVRVWDSDPSLLTAKFNESEIVAAAVGTDTYIIPNNIGLSDINVIFPKAGPTGPVSATSGTPAFDSTAIKWNVPLSWNTAFGARKYEVYQVADSSGSTPVLIHTMINPDGRASSNTMDPRNWTWTGLNELTTYYVMIRAVNAFGTLDSNVMSFTTAIYPDLTVPIAVTDLTASYYPTASSITLSWSPPFDNDRSGALAACASYDIRVSREALVDLPQVPFTVGQTNPYNMTSWNSANSITTFTDFSPAPTIPAPVTLTDPPPPRQSCEIRGSLTGTYYFALKAQDASGNISYISNVAGIVTQVGSDEVDDYTLNSTTGGMGVTSVSFPFTPPFYVQQSVFPYTGAWVTTFGELVNALNIVAGANVVTALGYWDGTARGIRSITYPGPVYNPIDSERTNIVKGVSYQIWVNPTTTVIFVARGRR